MNKDIEVGPAKMATVDSSPTSLDEERDRKDVRIEITMLALLLILHLAVPVIYQYEDDNGHIHRDKSIYLGTVPVYVWIIEPALYWIARYLWAVVYNEDKRTLRFFVEHWTFLVASAWGYTLAGSVFGGVR